MPRQRLVLVGGAALVLLVAAGLTWWLTREEPRERVYTEATACLLTPSAGLSAPGVPDVWSVMQEVSLKTRAKVQYLGVTGRQTTANAVTYVNSLIQNRCDVILSVGDSPTAAAGAVAPSYPNVRFVLIGATGGSGPGNVTVLPAGTPDAQQRLRDVLMAEVGGG